MVKRDRDRKLKLRKHTLRRLDSIDLGRVVGGSWGGVPGDGENDDPPHGPGDPWIGRSATGSALC